MSALQHNQPVKEARMGILSWIVFGLVVGIIAKLLMPGRDPGGFIITMLLGVAGALLGGFLGKAMGFYGPVSRPVGSSPFSAPSCCSYLSSGRKAAKRLTPLEPEAGIRVGGSSGFTFCSQSASFSS